MSNQPLRRGLDRVLGRSPFQRKQKTADKRRAARAPHWTFETLEDRTAPALLAYEPFNYYVPSNSVDSTITDSAAVSLLGQGPGAGNGSTVGLTGTWTNDGPGTDLVVAGSLSYPTYPVYQGGNGTNVTNFDLGSGVPANVVGIGNSAISNGIIARGTTAQNEIALTTPFGDGTVTGSGTYYVSFLMGQGFNAGAALFPQALSLISTDSDHKDIEIGWTNANKLVAGNSSQVFSGSATGVTFNQSVTLNGQQALTIHLVAAITFTPNSNTTVSLYLNPGFGSAPASGSLISTADLGADYHNIGAIGIKDSNRVWFDEIRIAGTYTDLWSDPQAQGASPTLAAQSSDPRFNGIRVPVVADAVRNGANNGAASGGSVSNGAVAVPVVALGGGANNLTNAGLFKFSDGSASGLSNLVPTGFDIASANVVLTGFYPQPYAGSTVIPTAAYKVTSTWDDSAANPNPTLDTSASIATGTGTAANGRYTYDITALAKQWLLGTTPNNGVAIAQTSGSATLDFFSREWSNSPNQVYFVGAADRPTLVLTLVRNTGLGISSNGGGSAAAATGSVNVPANTTAVTTVTVANPTNQSLTFGALTGTNAGLFNITSGGVLSFNSAPTVPGLYSVTVNVSGTGGSGNATASQTLSVRVTPEGVPTLDAISNANLPINSTQQTVNLTGISSPNASTAGIISVNFTDNGAGTTLTSGQTPGVIPVGNWNNKSTTAASAMNDSSGAATGVTVAFSGGAGEILNTNIYSVQPGSPSAANNLLMEAGILSGNTITLGNLNAQYANGYDLYVYVSPQYSFSNGIGVISDGTTSLTYNVTGVAFQGLQQSTGKNAPGNWVVFTNKTANSLTLTNNSVSANGWNTGGFAQTYITGLQIVPRAAPQPLRFTTTSSNTALIPQAAVTYSAGSSTASLAYTPTAGMSGTSTINVNVSDGNYVTTKTFTVTVTASLPTPTLDTISDKTINEDSSQQTVNLTGISDGHSGTDTLVITATSDNLGLIPNGNIGINYTSPNPTGTLNYTPTALVTGTANITVKVHNNANSQEFTRTFLVTVNHVNHAPTINSLADISTYLDPGLQTVNLSGISPGLGGDTEAVTVTAVSDNHSVIPDPDVSYVSGSTGSISFTPVAGQLGVAHVTVTVNDGSLQTQRTFTVTISPRYTHLDPITNVSFNEDTSGNAVNFAGISVDGVVAPPPRVVSINVYDGGNSLAASSFAGAYSASNWNNVPLTTNGTYGGAVVANDGTGTSIGVQMSGSTPNSTETVSGTSPNAVMMTGEGLRSVYNLNGNNDPNGNYYAQVQLSNLSSLFGAAGGGATTSHYDVYVYYGVGYNGNPVVGNFMGGSGTMILSSNGYTAATSDYPTTQTANILASQGYATILGNRAGFPDTAAGVPAYTYSDTTYPTISGTGFIRSQGTGSGNRGNYVKMTNLSSDNLVITPVVNTVGYQWNTCVILGIQIVEIPVASAPVTVTATSSNPTLVPDPTVTYVSPNAGGSLSMTPVANKYGTATITVTASSPNTTSTVRTFDVTVNNVNDAPTIATIADQSVNEDAGQQVVGLTGITPGPFETENVTVTATSDNQTLLPNANLSVSYANPSTTATLNYTTATNRYGVAVVTVTVNDGSLTTSRKFKVVVNEVNDAPALAAIGNVSVPADSGPHVVNLTGISAGPFEFNGLSNDAVKIVSINIEDSGYVLATGDSAGVVPATYWNNVPMNTTGTPYGQTVVTSNNTPTSIGVKMSGRGANTPERVSGTSPNAIMMSGSGLQSMYGDGGGGGGSNRYAQVQLSNLSSLFGDPTFANYDVYVYYGVGYNASNGGPFMGGTGDMIASTGEYTDVTTDFPTNTILQSLPYATMTGTATGLSDATYVYSDTANYSGLTGSGFKQSTAKSDSGKGNYVKFSALTVDNLVITAKVDPSTANWNTCAIVGIQIVGHNIPQPMSVTAVSDNPTLIPNPTVDYTAPAASGTLTYTPAAGQSGTANVTVTVNDGGLTSQQTFQVTVNPGAAVVSSVTPFVGPTAGGNYVVIMGSNFVGIDPTHADDAVKFGSGTTFANAISYTVNSLTQITAVAPAGTDMTTVNVVITSSAGSSTNDGTSGATGTTANDYSYATPAVTSVVVNGGMMTLTGAVWGSGATSITVDSTANLVVGSQLSSVGAGFPESATVVSVTNSTTFVISQPTSSAQGTATTIVATPLPVFSGGLFNLTGATWFPGSTFLTVDDTSLLQAGMSLSSTGAGFPNGTTVVSVQDLNTVEISTPTSAAQLTPTTIRVAGGAAARDGFGNLVDLSSSGSVVQHVLVTFNMRVLLDSNADGTSQAFSVASLAGSVTSLGAMPSSTGAAVTATGVTGTGDATTGYTQYVLNFVPGAGVNNLSNSGSGAAGNAFTTLSDGLYRLDTVGAKVHAGLSTIADRSDNFWSLYGVSNVGDVKITGAVGGGDDTVLVDGLALNDTYRAFGSFATIGSDAYSTAFDRDLDGDVDGVDLSHLYSNFGTIWKF